MLKQNTTKKSLKCTLLAKCFRGEPYFGSAQNYFIQALPEKR